MIDEAVICVHCGRMVNEQPAPAAQQKSGSNINIMCLLGFIFSFLTSIVGLILSIVGFNQVKNTPDNTSKNLAKAGIIISSISLGITVLVVGVYLFIFLSFLVTGIIYL